MNFFFSPHNDQYYHLQKYWPFLLNHLLISLFFEASRPALRVTQPPTHCVIRSSLLRAQQQGRETARSPPSGVEINVLYLHSPPLSLQGAVHKQRDSTFILSNINIKGDEMGGTHSMDGRMDFVIFRSLKLMYIIFKNCIPSQKKTLLLYEDLPINLGDAVTLY